MSNPWIPMPMAGFASQDAIAVYDQGARSLRAISAEFSDYAQRVLADGTVTANKVAAATTLPEAIGLLAAFSKRASKNTWSR